MITARAFRGKRYAVLGLARSGLATVEALLASGAEVVAWDTNEDAREAAVDAVQDFSISLESVLLKIADPLTIDLAGFDGVIVSPGVPINRHPIADHARAAGVPLIGDIELFAMARAELPPHKVVGITGTNGKSTTTALIHHILQVAGVPSLMGGNIGLPILGRDPLPAGGVYVLELSSYQIDLTYTLDCDVAALTNITPDHLDRYENMAAYEMAKARLFFMQSESHWHVYDTDQPGVCSLDDLIDTEHLRSFEWGLGVDKNELRAFLPVSLAGPHNLNNASLALNSVSAALGYDYNSPVENLNQLLLSLKSYPGLPHRMEPVGKLNGVSFVNDSKATNPDSAAPALAAYPEIHWILGGQAKTDELDACAPHFGHVRAAYTIGEAGPMFAKLLIPHMPVTECVTLDVAVNKAAAAAKPGETVLLSPACASFDQFTDYEARGAAFRAAVEAL